MLAPVPCRPVRTVILAALGLGLVTGACRISNEDHCVHKALDADAWCADNVEGRPYCSPCEAADHGCVADQPDADDCPAYTPDTGTTTDTSGTTA
jgi:hypothetical protein